MQHQAADLLGDHGGSRRAISGHERSPTGKDEWLTPPFILAALGAFDLDPCAPVRPPWPTAARSFNRFDNGLTQPWAGRVFLNPPYGREAVKWVARLAAHDRGTAMLFARTDTKLFHEQVWPRAAALFFFRGRVNFFHATGQPTPGRSGAPSVLVAYGDQDFRALRDAAISKLSGVFVPLIGL